MPVQAVAYTTCGFQRSMVRVMTSESSIIPACMGSQVWPPSVGLPAEVPGADVHDVRVLRIEGHGVEVAEVGMVRRRDARPGLPAVHGAEHAGEGAGGEDLRAAGGDGERAHRLALDALEDGEGVAAVGAAGDAAAVAADFPVADEHDAARVHRDVVEAVSAPREAGAEAAPVGARVVRSIEEAVGGAEVDAPRVARVGGQRAHVAARAVPPGSTSAPRRARARPAPAPPLQRCVRTSAMKVPCPDGQCKG